MKLWTMACCLFTLCASVHAGTAIWSPAVGQVQIPIWPVAAPDLQPVPGDETVKVSEELLAGKPVTAVTNVTRPTMTVYPPLGKNTGAAVVVFPGGGFQILAIDLEGSEICDWLTSRGITCVLLKYRVPGAPYDWHCDCRPQNYDLSVPSLQDAQRTLGLVRFHAAQWHVDPHKIGVIGFSAGGYLVAEVSTHFKHRAYAPVDEADRQSSRPDFAMAIYPGHIVTEKGQFNRHVQPLRDTPPTFLVQAEDDHVDGVDQALFYYNALKKAGVPAEMHIYAHGGHAFGLRPTSNPITHWPALAETWMSALGIIISAIADNPVTR